MYKNDQHQRAVVLQQPQTAYIVPTPGGPARQPWRTSLFSVCEGGTGVCLYGYCLPGCAIASARTDMDGSDCCFNCLCMNSVASRNITRETYQLEGGCCSDMFVGVCCAPCSACQNVNEVRKRGAVRLPNHAETEWSADMFTGCCATGCGNCLYGWFCPACAFASARSEQDGSDCCFNYCCLTPCLIRSLVRSQYNIAGGCCGDICCTTWCYPCVATQLLNEVDKRGKVNKMVTLAAPVQQQAMYR